jgi:putative ABC transport system substrate-binding protein
MRRPMSTPKQKCIGLPEQKYISNADSCCQCQKSSPHLARSELVPQAATIAVLVNPTNPNVESDKQSAQAAARARGRQLLIVNARSVSEIDAAYATLVEQGVGALLIGTDILFTNQRDQFVVLGARYAIPTMHQWAEFVTFGVS